MQSASTPLSASLSVRGTVRVTADGRELGVWTDPSEQAIVLPAASGAPVAVQIIYDKPADTLPLVSLIWSTPDGAAPLIAPDAAAFARAARESAARRMTTLACLIGMGLCLLQILRRHDRLAVASARGRFRRRRARGAGGGRIYRLAGIHPPPAV